MDAVIYHNSRCSKSRATMAILEEKGVNIETVYYLETPPTTEELETILKKLDKNPVEVIRFGEAIAKELDITKKDERPRDEWISIMVNNPKLIERPIVVVGDRAALGRPPENVLELLD